MIGLVFSSAVEIFFWQKWLSPARKKARTPMPWSEQYHHAEICNVCTMKVMIIFTNKIDRE